MEERLIISIRNLYYANKNSVVVNAIMHYFPLHELVKTILTNAQAFDLEEVVWYEIENRVPKDMLENLLDLEMMTYFIQSVIAILYTDLNYYLKESDIDLWVYDNTFGKNTVVLKRV